MNNIMTEEIENKSQKKRGRKPKVKTEDTVDVKIPKKRGRKPKPKIEEELTKIHKKRGRKPKPKSDEPKIPKKRGRKPKDKFGVVEKDSNNINVDDNIILHLPIKPKILKNHEPIESKLLRYNPNIGEPAPYEPKNMNSNISPYPFNLNPEDLKKSELKNENLDNEKKNNLEKTTTEISMEITDKPKKKEINEKHECDVSNLLDKLNKKRDNEVFCERNVKSSYILMEYNESNKTNVWPKNTKIDCFWCCHSFNNFPFCIPVKRTEDTFHVFGNFCSPECAAAYNFDSSECTEEIWERYSLMNILYIKNIDGIEIDIKIAPPRIILKKFGGTLEIEEFRKTNINYEKDYIITLPPMLSIIPYMEESNIDLYTKKNKFVPLDTNRIKTINNEYKLKRSRPLPDSHNTLENCMNLKYV